MLCLPPPEAQHNTHAASPPSPPRHGHVSIPIPLCSIPRLESTSTERGNPIPCPCPSRTQSSPVQPKHTLKALPPKKKRGLHVDRCMCLPEAHPVARNNNNTINNNKHDKPTGAVVVRKRNACNPVLEARTKESGLRGGKEQFMRKEGGGRGA
ncbi:uncharacterized protein K444DRAFT_608000 [Hyaloscypha bicolor E]|uniref:Uncharacterized protein n=1 Tax=Hyaloscypha bicolor E TaxID=1095630 RepID=A0A2J6TQX8_9HELO|nr:uncharacterized protein K444DRAFT_608000 [Hyaloscypha bicolor E]PMD65431.1 hypothetical protein K444DRAFT_608000 [Hyaloscypha bicolor E]